MAEKLTNIHHIWLTGVVFPWSELFQSSCQSAETVATYVDTTLLILIITVTLLTRMHSSRMRTGHSLTVCWSLLPGGGGSGPGGCLVWGESAPRGVSSQGGSAPGGSAPRGVWSRGGGVWSRGVLVWGVYPSMHWGRPPVDRHMPVKILPWPNFVAAGKNDKTSFSNFADYYNLATLTFPVAIRQTKYGLFNPLI